MRVSTWRWGAVTAAILCLATTAAAKTYTVDTAHTGVSFKIRHLFTNVEGRFTEFSGTIEFDPADPDATTITGEITTASINTTNEKRDKHLRSGDFFDVERYPKITFVSTKVSAIDAAKKTAKLHGTLTLHGVEKPVVLDVAYLGTGSDPWGNERGGFTATMTINRKDFGLNWNEALETGGFLVGDEVRIEINVEGLVE